jgi:hypothetical protein
MSTLSPTSGIGSAGTRSNKSPEDPDESATFEVEGHVITDLRHPNEEHR